VAALFYWRNFTQKRNKKVSKTWKKTSDFGGFQSPEAREMFFGKNHHVAKFD
jgi:hypothetical protein